MPMLSRVAEHLYWLGRYMERAEDTARLVNVNAVLLLDLPRGISPGWKPLVDITSSTRLYEARYGDYDERNVVRFLIADPEHPSSLVSCLRQARQNARTVREIVPRESWEALNNLYLYATENVSTGLSKRGRYDYLTRIIEGCQLHAGVVLGTMLHDEGYAFLTLGKLIERADMTTRIIDVRSASLLPEETSGLRPYENIQWMSVLKSLAAYQSYRLKMHVRVRRALALEFLLRDDEFPRAVMRAVLAAESYLRRLPEPEASLRVVGRVRRLLDRAPVEELARSNDALHAYLEEVQLALAALDDVVHERWFRFRDEPILAGGEGDARAA